MKIPFLIDTDTASDDAVALIMALRSSEIQVLAITAVAGNVDVEQAARNALYTAELCGADVPVFLGAANPLQRAHAPADWFHGKERTASATTAIRFQDARWKNEVLLMPSRRQSGRILVWCWSRLGR